MSNDTVNSYTIKALCDATEPSPVDSGSEEFSFCREDVEQLARIRYDHYTVQEFKNTEVNGRHTLCLKLVPGPDIWEQSVRCSHCREEFQLKNAVRRGYSQVTLKDAKEEESFVFCSVTQPRVRCPHCGRIITVAPKFKHQHHNITCRMHRSARVLMVYGTLSINEISRITGLNPNILREIEDTLLRDKFKKLSFISHAPKRIGIDEHSVRSGHDYVTVIYDLDTTELVYFCRGKRKEDLQPFFDHLKETGKAEQIEVVSCDCSSGFISMVQANLPNARISLDEFHVIKIFGKASERVRSREVKKLLALAELLNRRKRYGACSYMLDTPYKHLSSFGVDRRQADKLIAGMKLEDVDRLRAEAQKIIDIRWMPALGLEKLQKRADSEEIQAVIMNNDVLLELAYMGDDLRKIWHAGLTPEETLELIDALIKRGKLLCCPEMDRFCRFLGKHKEQLIYAGTFKVSNSIVEGMNSAAKAIQRVTRGVKDIVKYGLRLHIAFRGRRDKDKRGLRGIRAATVCRQVFQPACSAV